MNIQIKTFQSAAAAMSAFIAVITTTGCGGGGGAGGAYVSRQVVYGVGWQAHTDIDFIATRRDQDSASPDRVYFANPNSWATHTGDDRGTNTGASVHVEGVSHWTVREDEAYRGYARSYASAPVSLGVVMGYAGESNPRFTQNVTINPGSTIRVIVVRSGGATRVIADELTPEEICEELPEKPRSTSDFVNDPETRRYLESAVVRWLP